MSNETQPSTDDSRTRNNTMRHQYRTLTETEKADMLKVKDMGLAFVEFLDTMPPTREISHAKTNAEQAVMWAVKHITG